MSDESQEKNLAATEPSRAAAPDRVRCFVLTVSDTSTPATDAVGTRVAELLEKSGHIVICREIVSDTTTAIESTTRASVYHRDEPEAIIVIGGVGIGQQDITPEALLPLLTKEIPAFGDTLRQLTFAQSGASALQSRAFAGVLGRTLLFALPDEIATAQMALEKLILPELANLIREVRPERKK